ncbi:hypothetical protein M413DRAFT_21088 [Hebeloma cylindrosporum]|uniref:Uncharacterized protein n=1 Tax=Hebeloma cylindrosporum TaxID=76867 RepID=A0A0C2Z6E8_HEBCY|nr:hypothetical protein M413DRAFT_21088 [Hebeloma cylindrosporum h7]
MVDVVSSSSLIGFNTVSALKRFNDAVLELPSIEEGPIATTHDVLRQSSRPKTNLELQTKSDSIPPSANPPRARENAQAPVQAPPRRKKQKVASDKPHEDDFRKTKGRRGRLKLMAVEMPIDILLEISATSSPLTSFVSHA